MSDQDSPGPPCPCGSVPCRVLPVNCGATWFYNATRKMSDGQRMIFRAYHSDPAETRVLVSMVLLAAAAFSQAPGDAHDEPN